MHAIQGAAAARRGVGNAAPRPRSSRAVTGSIDVEGALRRRDDLAAHWDDAAQVAWLKGAVWPHPRARPVLGERRVDVTASDGSVRRFEVRRAVVGATGSSASFPPIPGLVESGIWDSRDVTTAKDVPRRLLVIGGGVVGVEMAQAWKWLGSDEVTIVELFDHLLSREERFAGDELNAALTRMGITVHTSATTTAIERAGRDGPVTATLELGDLHACPPAHRRSGHRCGGGASHRADYEAPVDALS